MYVNVNNSSEKLFAQKNVTISDLLISASYAADVHVYWKFAIG
jgi:hypothetical protein